MKFKFNLENNKGEDTMSKNTNKTNNFYELSDANRYITDKVISNKEYTNISINRLASEDANDLPGRPTDVLAGSANSPTARRDYSFITESYSNGAKFLATGNIPFFVKFSVCKNNTNPDRLTMYIDIILKPGDKPLKYVIDGRSSRYRYEVKNSIAENQSHWSGWERILSSYDVFSYARIGRLRNRSRNTSIVPRNMVPYCAGGVVADENNTLYAYLQLHEEQLLVPLTEVDPAVPENTKTAKYFSHTGSYKGDIPDQTEYDITDLGL